MNLTSVLLIAFILIPFASSQETPEEQMEFMRNFFCVMGTQKFLQLNNNILPPLDDPRSMPASWRKLLAVSYRECLLDTQDQSLLMQLANARSKEEADQINFPFFSRIAIPAFLEEADFGLSVDDNKLLELSQRTTEKIMKMQQDQEGANKQGGRPTGSKAKNAPNKNRQETVTEPVKVDWLQWAWDSQFRNVFIFSGVATILILLSSIVNLFRVKTPVKVEKNPKKKEKVETDKSNSKAKQE